MYLLLFYASKDKRQLMYLGKVNLSSCILGNSLFTVETWGVQRCLCVSQALLFLEGSLARYKINLSMLISKSTKFNWVHSQHRISFPRSNHTAWTETCLVFPIISYFFPFWSWRKLESVHLTTGFWALHRVAVELDLRLIQWLVFVIFICLPA